MLARVVLFAYWQKCGRADWLAQMVAEAARPKSADSRATVNHTVVQEPAVRDETTVPQAFLKLQGQPQT